MTVPRNTFDTPQRVRSLGALLFAAMAAATFSVSALSVVASFIIDDLSISRQQLGFVATANTALAAVLSPRAGRFVDRLGGRNGLIVVYFFGGAAFAIMGVAGAYWILLAAAAVAALSQASGNPATNKLIARHLAQGRRGVVTGIKQSGVQAATFVGGLLLPIGAESIGWRPTMLIAGAVALAAIFPVLRVIPEDRPDASAGDNAAGPLPRSTRWLAAYGGLLGFGGAAVFFVPLFAQEALGYGPRAGGLAAALVGLVAFGGRIAWARFTERGERVILTLGLMAVLSMVAGLAFLGATSSSALLWVAVAVVGMSSSSWNSVGMLAVIHDAGAEQAGRASGRVMFGFLLGLGIGSPLYGRTIDSTGGYALMWWIAIAAYAAATVLILAWSRSVARQGLSDGALPDKSKPRP